MPSRADAEPHGKILGSDSLFNPERYIKPCIVTSSRSHIAFLSSPSYLPQTIVFLLNGMPPFVLSKVSAAQMRVASGLITRRCESCLPYLTTGWFVLIVVKGIMGR